MLDTLIEKTKGNVMRASLKVKVSIIILLLVGGFIVYFLLTSNKKNTTQYQTEKAAKGNLIVTITGSGTVSTSNNGIVSTLATGVVSKVYVKDGDEVKAGDKIADVDLDLQGKQNANQALSNYQSAKNSVDTAQANMFSTQSTMFTNWDAFMKIAQNGTYQYEDGSPNNINRSLPEFHIADDNWLASEAKYKTQQNIVYQTQTALSASWSQYQQTSPTIYAPISGTISGLSLQEGSVIVASTNSNSAQSSTKIASVKTKALPTVSINLTEIDVPKIHLGDKATVTFDAFSDKTFTGKVISIDTSGVVSSGVTTYPAVIKLDVESDSILPNMAASANIITATKDNVLLVTSTAVKTQTDGTSYVQVMKNNLPMNVTVETGLSSDTQTEITSGLSDGDTIVTSTITATKSSQSSSAGSQSPFGSFSGGARGGGGGGFRGN